MYQSLLPILKPLIYEGKSGVLEIVHKYGDSAKLYLKEGIIDQIETKNSLGTKAGSICTQWASFTTTFKEGKPVDYASNPTIDTMALLSFLEKTNKNIPVINNNIPGDTVVYQIDSNKLRQASKLRANDLKLAMLFDGKRNLAEIISISGHSELAVLTRTCRLIFAGVASEVTLKNVMPQQERESFLKELKVLLLDIIGPAGEVLVEDAFETIQSEPDQLAKEDIAPLLSAIGKLLEEEEKAALTKWGSKYI